MAGGVCSLLLFFESLVFAYVTKIKLTYLLTYSKVGCKFEEGSRGEMFKKSRARELDGKEDDDSPPEPR